MIALASPSAAPGRVLVAATGVLALLAVSAGAARAAELPNLRHGLWEIRGNANGTKIDNRKCTSPSEELKIENEMLAKTGCKVSPVKRSGKQYTYTSECDVKTRGGLALKSSRTTVLKVGGDREFELRVRGTANGRPVEEAIAGKRIGDCAK